MKKRALVLMVIFAFVMGAPSVWAKKDGSPAGWTKGEKKGWGGGSTPPGWSKKDADKAEKKAKAWGKDGKKKAKEVKEEIEEAAKS